MKLVKKPISDQGWATEIKCTGNGNGGKGCQAIFEITWNDLRYYPGSDSNSWVSSDPAVIFKCPICSTSTDLKRDQYPNHVKSLPIVDSHWINNRWEDIKETAPHYETDLKYD